MKKFVVADTPLSMRLFLALLECSNRALAEVESNLRPHGLSGPRLRVLIQLYRGEPLTASELGRRFCVSKPNMTQLLQGLEAEGLIAREQAASDQRRQSIRLSSAGRRLVVSILPNHRALVASLFAELSGRELSELLSLLGKVGASLDAAHPAGAFKSKGENAHETPAAHRNRATSRSARRPGAAGRPDSV